VSPLARGEEWWDGASKMDVLGSWVKT